MQVARGLQGAQARRIGRADIDDDITPYIEKFLKTGAIIVERLLKWRLGILAQVDAYGSPVRRAA